MYMSSVTFTRIFYVRLFASSFFVFYLCLLLSLSLIFSLSHFLSISLSFHFLLTSSSLWLYFIQFSHLISVHGLRQNAFPWFSQLSWYSFWFLITQAYRIFMRRSLWQRAWESASELAGGLVLSFANPRPAFGMFRIPNYINLDAMKLQRTAPDTSTFPAGLKAGC